MELIDFFHRLQADIKESIAEQLEAKDHAYPFSESIFTEYMMQHMVEAGMTFESATPTFYQNKIGNANLKMNGYAFSDDCEQLDIFVSLYTRTNLIENIADSETKMAADQCFRFLSRCFSGKLAKEIEPSNIDIHTLAVTLEENYAELNQIRIYVLTDKRAKTKNFKSREEGGKTIKLEVMDIERLYNHTVAGKPRDELIVDFKAICGAPLPCVYVPNNEIDYDYALTALPGEALRFLYEKYGARLLEANVRSFLSVTGKVNKGIRDTLRHDPSRFMAYNNGLVIVADDIRLESSSTGEGIIWLKGMQVVNGGQTVASLYFTKKKAPEIDLSKVKIPAKIIILRKEDGEAEEELISAISRYANSQNVVRQADLSANRPFHRELEKIATSVYCSDGMSQWFYERASGSYNVLLTRDGDTSARLKRLKERIPTSRKLTKTDLAKYFNTWEKKPHIVALGAQKNFDNFMRTITEWEKEGFLPDFIWFKNLIAKAIIFKQCDKIVAPLGTASKIHVTTHIVSLFAEKFGEQIDFDKIWDQQDLSPQLKNLFTLWAPKVNEIMVAGSNGKLLGEWAKKEECWDQVKNASSFKHTITDIPEIKLL